VGFANLNTPSQIVISGALAEIRQVEALMQGNMVYVPLNTSGAFHSRFMTPAADEFRSYLKSFALADPKIPVIANVTGRPYERGAVAENLATQISSTVRWCDSVQFLLQLGSNGAEEVQFEEIGHGDVLTKLVRTIRQQTPPLVQTSRPIQARPPVEAPQTPKPPRTKAQDRVNEWNSKYPVGIRVQATVTEYEGKELETRTEALLLFGHRAAVYMKGYNGYFDLEEVAPL
jgi:hypothetical protein